LHQITTKDPNHQIAAFFLHWIESYEKLTTIGSEVRPAR
jgi:hypothetical protein